MKTPFITYKGEQHPLKITNAVFIRFTRLGGSLQNLETDPVGEAITLLCAVLDLKGDPLEHADNFPPVPAIVQDVLDAVEVYQGGNSGESNGGGSEPPRE